MLTELPHAVVRAVKFCSMRASRGMGAISKGKVQSVKKKDGNFPVVLAKTGKWIQSAIKKPGALRAELGIKAGQKIPAKKLAKAAKAPGKLGQRARLAETLKGLHK